ncbi:helix-turn-helix domain-containing protein [Streptomyces sp. DH37]|uniref:helix-turn-helix domain-containing protein n=1 Tax=Streptomyces sp. DH37 TaxID=3040122 RepID=UPI002441FFAB|nr:hypothetical protein [Streptomyces sp. DH37]MDG9705567.1 hypothetical protein [Streptomyces sp. DH37]
MSLNQLFQPLPAGEPAPPTPNQLVSYNLLRARRTRGWTQQDLGEKLGKYTGRAWSNASVSAAERAWQGGRPRNFDADEITAFCQIFDLPFSYFLMPPEENLPGEISVAEESKRHALGFPVIEFLKCVLGVDPPPEHEERVGRIVEEVAQLGWVPPRWEYGPEWVAPEDSAERPSSGPGLRTAWKAVLQGKTEAEKVRAEAMKLRAESAKARAEAAKTRKHTARIKAEMERSKQRNAEPVSDELKILRRLPEGQREAAISAFSMRVAEEVIKIMQSRGYEFIEPPEPPEEDDREE